MPKLKTRKAIAKRFKLTKNRKIKRSRAFRGHLRSGKRPKRKMSLRSRVLVSKADELKLRKQMPYW